MDLITDIPDGSELITIYNKEDGKVQYFEYDGVVCVNVHSEKEKYSIGILRAIKHIEKKYDKYLSVLPYGYLVEFYAKHYDLEKIDEYKDLYLINRRY